MKEELITKAYEVAKERYAALGIDVEKVMEQLQKVAISMHCWQADDVIGFESGGSLTGGIQLQVIIPVRPVIWKNLRSDILKVLLIYRQTSLESAWNLRWFRRYVCWPWPGGSETFWKLDATGRLKTGWNWISTRLFLTS